MIKIIPLMCFFAIYALYLKFPLAYVRLQVGCIETLVAFSITQNALIFHRISRSESSSATDIANERILAVCFFVMPKIRRVEVGSSFHVLTYETSEHICLLQADVTHRRGTSEIFCAFLLIAGGARVARDTSQM